MSGYSNSLCFPDKGPYVVDTCLACPSASEQAWDQRYNYSKGQSGGKMIDVTREFMISLLKGLVSDFQNAREQRIRKCDDRLKSLVDDDFVYNNTKGSEGLDLICRHIADLRDAFPKMDLSVTHFRDFEKHSAVSIVVAQGIMDGPWLNRPATKEYEHLAITFHLVPNKQKNKIKQVHFRSEFLTEDTYRKIRALDLLHTAFAVNSSAKSLIKNAREGKVEDRVETVPVIGVPLLLAASTMANQGLPEKVETPAETPAGMEAEFAREIEEVERRAKEESVKQPELDVIDLDEGDQDLEDVEDELEDVEDLQDKLAPEVDFEENQNLEEDDNINENLDENENNEINLRNVNIDDTQEVLELAAKNPEEMKRQINMEIERLQEELREEGQEDQAGGDGYYAAVEKIPVGGQPVYQGYSSCCPPYFVTDGSQFDPMCQGGGGEVALGSKTLSMMKDGVVYSITATVLDEEGNATAHAMGMRGRMKNKVKHHLAKHMYDHAHAVVSKNVENGMAHMEKALPHHHQDLRLVMIPEQGGGNLLGSLGTILFPAGSTVDNVVPWLLTIGALMGKRMETDLFDLTTKAKKTSTKSRTRKAPAKTKKTTKSTKSRKAPAKSKKSKPRKAPAKTTKSTKSRKIVRRRGPKKGRRWEPLTNADIRRMMSQRGGFCGAGICGDASLSPFDGCKRPEWGPRNWINPNAKDPICV